MTSPSLPEGSSNTEPPRVADMSEKTPSPFETEVLGMNTVPEYEVNPLLGRSVVAMFLCMLAAIPGGIFLGPIALVVCFAPAIIFIAGCCGFGLFLMVRYVATGRWQ
jgi:hypothetical protein